jgi:outer membrane protein assembly factor BamB
MHYTSAINYAEYIAFHKKYMLKKFLKNTILQPQNNNFQAMVKRWSNTLLFSLLTATFFFAGCSHNYSPDNPIPATFTNSVIINSDNQVIYAIDPATGKKNWELSFTYLNTVPNTKYAASPVLYNGSIYMVFLNSDTLYKINAMTGAIEQKITWSGRSFGTQATPVADANFIYVAGSNGYLYAVDTSGNSSSNWQFNTTSSMISSPTVYNGQVYCANSIGHVYSINKTTGPDHVTGNPTWDWPGNGVTSTAQFASSPAISGPYIYLGSVSDSNMYCIYLNTPTPLTTPPNTGVLRWTYKTKGEIYSSPTVYGGRCIFGSLDFNVYCLDTSIAPLLLINPTFTPRPIWITTTASQVYSSPYADNQYVYIGSNDQNLYSLNIIDGSVKWKFTSLGLIKSSPVVYQGTVFVGSYDKYIYALDSATGTQKWNVNTNGTIECSPVLNNQVAMFGYNSGITGFIN